MIIRLPPFSAHSVHIVEFELVNTSTVYIVLLQYLVQWRTIMQQVCYTINCSSFTPSLLLLFSPSFFCSSSSRVQDAEELEDLKIQLQNKAMVISDLEMKLRDHLEQKQKVFD